MYKYFDGPEEVSWHGANASQEDHPKATGRGFEKDRGRINQSWKKLN